MLTDSAAPQAEFLHSVVASGRYRSEVEALNEAIRLLQRRDELRAQLEQGEKELDAGMAIPAEQVFDSLESRARQLDQEYGGPRP
jgi:Arc/MetJ-type ribon-helix-helix transcriptional regulator